ncbi:glycosyl transferase family 1, partial [Candidatus Shapirobacteria bacterium CG10_big_fil_rev_8_21_14_0_10_38_14]
VALYQQAEAFVFPSLLEGFGLPGVEAMAVGLPVLASNSSCLPEVYGPAAIYFDPLNVNEMASKIEKIISDKKLREKMIK